MSDHEQQEEEEQETCECGHCGRKQTTYLNPVDDVQATIETAEAVALLKSADAIIIGAGAGASIPAGINYADRAKFAKQFPGLVAIGIRDYWSMIGNYDVTPEQTWGYLSQHILEMRFNTPQHTTYKTLRQIVGQTPHFVLTSNVDGQFEHNGFDKAQILTPQGDFGLLQCEYCRTVWPSKPIAEQLAQSVDHATCSAATNLLPKCASCGRDARPHVNGGRWFVHETHQAQWRAFERFIAQHKDKKVVLLDIGSGFNTPGVVRVRLEQIADALPRATLVRLNKDYAHVPAHLAEQGKAKMLPIDFAQFAAESGVTN